MKKAGVQAEKGQSRGPEVSGEDLQWGKRGDLHACSMASGSGSYLEMQVGCCRSRRNGACILFSVVLGDQFWVQMSGVVSRVCRAAFILSQAAFQQSCRPGRFSELQAARLYLGSCMLAQHLPPS